VDRAVATARGIPAGPVHLNLPFREPLVPDDTLAPAEGAASPGPFGRVVAAPAALPPDDLAALTGRIGAVERGLIVAGPQEDPKLPTALARLAAATGFPIAADPLSGVRCGPHDRTHVLAHADHLVRAGAWIDGHRPELVIRFGATPTSKPILTLLAAGAAQQIVVDGDRTWSEPAIIPTTFVQADATSTAEALAAALVDLPARWGTTSDWADEWCRADRAADGALRDWLAGVVDRDEPFEGQPFAVLGEILPDGALLWAGNSMPVRDLDDWLPTSGRAIRPLSNRGANGIDGVVSTALGSAAGADGPVVLVVGDLSFLHDLNALVAARLHGLSATIVLIDNDGGGIFSFLPVAREGDAFVEHVATPHGLDFGRVAELYGCAFERADHPEAFRAALERGLQSAGVSIVAVRTDRDENVVLHRRVWDAVGQALRPTAEGR
jgi:2-succinyl-5-enolpyruvyl-6-hydroxy-3-cyclohexene-1-carboxylate synthase